MDSKELNSDHSPASVILKWMSENELFHQYIVETEKMMFDYGAFTRTKGKHFEQIKLFADREFKPFKFRDMGKYIRPSDRPKYKYFIEVSPYELRISLAYECEPSFITKENEDIFSNLILMFNEFPSMCSVKYLKKDKVIEFSSSCYYLKREEMLDWFQLGLYKLQEFIGDFMDCFCWARSNYDLFYHRIPRIKRRYWNHEEADETCVSRITSELDKLQMKWEYNPFLQTFYATVNNCLLGISTVLEIIVHGNTVIFRMKYPGDGKDLYCTENALLNLNFSGEDKYTNLFGDAFRSAKIDVKEDKCEVLNYYIGKKISFPCSRIGFDFVEAHILYLSWLMAYLLRDGGSKGETEKEQFLNSESLLQTCPEWLIQADRSDLEERQKTKKIMEESNNEYC